MTVLQKGEEWSEDDNFMHTVVVFVHENRLHHAKVNLRMQEVDDTDLSKLVLNAVKIRDDFFPLYEPSTFGKIICSSPSDSVYVKYPNMLDYSTSETNADIGELMEKEAAILNLLREAPHPNLCTYKGCIVREGRVRGLCLDKYEYSLSDLVLDRSLDKNVNIAMIMASLRMAVAHLHELGLAHNDINPGNVMFKSDKNVVLIDFDSAAPENHKLIKIGTPGWVEEDLKVSSTKNDLAALARMSDYLCRIFGSRGTIRDLG